MTGGGRALTVCCELSRGRDWSVYSAASMNTRSVEHIVSASVEADTAAAANVLTVLTEDVFYEFYDFNDILFTVCL